jgi:hypothetical protein
MATGGRLISSMPFQSSPMNVGRRAFSSAAVRAFWHNAADALPLYATGLGAAHLSNFP